PCRVTVSARVPAPFGQRDGALATVRRAGGRRGLRRAAGLFQGVHDRRIAQDAGRTGLVGQREARNGLTQLRRELRQLADRARGRRRRLGGFAADLAQDLHVLRDRPGRDGLLLGRARDVLHEARDLVRHLLDLVERRTRVLGE